MTASLALAVAIIAVFLLLLFGATVELHRQVLQLRQFVGFVDYARALEFNPDVPVSSLPIAEERKNGRVVILLLNDSCTTCAEVARNLPKPLPAAMTVVLAARSADDANRWLDTYGLGSQPQVVYDENLRISEQLGVYVTPAAIKFEAGYSISASTVPSPRQMSKIVEWVGEGEKLANHGKGVN